MTRIVVWGAFVVAVVALVVVAVLRAMRWIAARVMPTSEKTPPATPAAKKGKK